MTVDTQALPKDWEQMTPAWMSQVLAAHHPGVVVDTVSVDLRDDGTNRRARLRLTYAIGSGPETVFVKAADPDHKELIRMTSGMFHEPNLFRSGVDLPLEHPQVYSALIDESSYDFVLVMEDISARGAQPRDATRPLTPEQAAAGVRGLGRLHGRYWGHRHRDHPALGWLEPFVPWGGMEIAPLPEAYERLGESIPDAVRSLTIHQLLDDVWKPYIRSLTVMPRTLLHGDPHIGNTYVLDDGDVGFLDWQVARSGNWSLDLGYFLQGALTVDDRRRHESALLDEYRSALDLPAAELPSAAEIDLGYRASVAHGLTLWLCTASAGDLWQRPDIAVALAHRYSVAYEDLDTAAAIRELPR
ncbi:phosphotransferase [Gordonia sp. CPCC 206044]|uniref:phosphotransferase n=1 Tax=Gordonia sp. CPCC 206044 TaxID=3140793 RepID=UPI003AF3D294